MIENKISDDPETINYVANHTRNGNYEYLYLIKDHHNISIDTLPLIKNIVFQINPKYKFITDSYSYRSVAYCYDKDMFLKMWIQDILVPFLITNIDNNVQIVNFYNQMLQKLNDITDELNEIKYAPGGYEFKNAQDSWRLSCTQELQNKI
jgi:hypothetical protein